MNKLKPQMLSDKPNEYPLIAKYFHWLRVVLLIIIVTSMYIYTSTYNISALTSHVAFGIIFFIVIIANILVRILHIYPQFHSGTHSRLQIIEHNIQKIIYYNIYFLLFLMPMLGYLSLTTEINLFIVTIKPIYSYAVISSFVTDTFYITPAFLFSTITLFMHRSVFILLIGLVCVHIIMVVFWQIKTKGKEIKKML